MQRDPFDPDHSECEWMLINIDIYFGSYLNYRYRLDISLFMAADEQAGQETNIVI